MKTEDLLRFAADLREMAGLNVKVIIDDKIDGMHVLKIAGTDFFFYANRPGYDGWGRGNLHWGAKPKRDTPSDR